MLVQCSLADVTVPIKGVDVHQHGPTGIGDISEVFTSVDPASKVLHVYTSLCYM